MKNEPAFPNNYEHDRYKGLSIRDYFAAKAMQGLVYGLMTKKGQKQAAYNMESQGFAYGEIDKFVAKCAYDYADAMIAARTPKEDKDE